MQAVSLPQARVRGDRPVRLKRLVASSALLLLAHIGGESLPVQHPGSLMLILQTPDSLACWAGMAP